MPGSLALSASGPSSSTRRSSTLHWRTATTRPLLPRPLGRLGLGPSSTHYSATRQGPGISHALRIELGSNHSNRRAVLLGLGRGPVVCSRDVLGFAACLHLLCDGHAPCLPSCWELQVHLMRQDTAAAAAELERLVHSPDFEVVYLRVAVQEALDSQLDSGQLVLQRQALALLLRQLQDKALFEPGQEATLWRLQIRCEGSASRSNCHLFTFQIRAQSQPSPHLHPTFTLASPPPSP